MSEEEIYNGIRGKKFKDFISALLKNGGKLKQEYIDKITDENGMKLYSSAFTHKTGDINNNYELYEFLGDMTANKAIVWYAYRRFPQLQCPEGNKILSRIKINYGSKQIFFELARKLGFWEFVTASVDIRQREMKQTLEDVFEAFLGVTEELIDTRIKRGAGYAICYNIIEYIFNDIHMSLNYEDLFDAKTRLKEIFDTFKDDLGQLVYPKKPPRVEKNGYELVNVKITIKLKGKEVVIGEGFATKKADAEQKAAEQAITYLENKGYKRERKEIYKRLCE